MKTKIFTNLGASDCRCALTCVQDIQPVSFKPLKLWFIPWFRFVLSLVASPEYPHPATYWDSGVSKEKCKHCGTWHNQSVHAHVAFCCSDHPMQVGYFASWGPAKAHVNRLQMLGNSPELWEQAMAKGQGENSRKEPFKGGMFCRSLGNL